MADKAFVHIYHGRLLADSHWLSAEHIGAYSLLLFALWNANGELPQDETKLARIARMSVARWREIWPDIEPFFVERDGRLTTIHVKRWRSKASVLGRGKLSADVRSTVYERDGGMCRYCSTTDGPFHVDHVIPVAKGGSDDLDNLVLACQPCNLSKGSKMLEEWQR